MAGGHRRSAEPRNRAVLPPRQAARQPGDAPASAEASSQAEEGDFPGRSEGPHRVTPGPVPHAESPTSSSIDGEINYHRPPISPDKAEARKCQLNSAEGVWDRRSSEDRRPPAVTSRRAWLESRGAPGGSVGTSRARAGRLERPLGGG